MLPLLLSLLASPVGDNVVYPSAVGPSASGVDGTWTTGNSVTAWSAQFGEAPLCTGPVTCIDQDGMHAGASTDTTDPSPMALVGGHCWPGDDSCSGGDLVLSAGQGATTVTIDDYTSCSGATTTFTVCTAAGCSDTTLTEGVDWSAVDSDEASAASFASATVAGVSLAAVSDVVRVTLAAGTLAVLLSRDTAACNSVTDGTPGRLFVRPGTAAAPGVAAFTAPDTGVFWSGSSVRLTAGGVQRIIVGASQTTVTNTLAVQAPVAGNNTITSSRTSDLGWTLQSAANQACITTCTNAAVFGWDTDSGNAPVGPDSADADICLCAGGS